MVKVAKSVKVIICDKHDDKLDGMSVDVDDYSNVYNMSMDVAKFISASFGELVLCDEKVGG